QRSFGKEVFKMFLPRLGTDSLVEALTSSLILYYQDIYAHQKDHIVNKAMENALERAIPTMDLNRAPGVLEKWGASIRKAFILENIAGLPRSVLQETLTEDQRAARFVSVNTFEDGISRVLAIAQMLVGETQDIKAQLLDMQLRLGRIERTQREEGSSQRLVADPSPPMELKPPPQWPKKLLSLRGVPFADVIFQCLCEDLHKMPRIKNHNAQSECMKAMNIAYDFIAKEDMPKSYQSLRSDSERCVWVYHTRGLAESVAAKVAQYLDDHAKNPRKRKRTTNASAMVRAYYKQRKTAARRQTITCSRAYNVK
ncbi:hypothetical protein BBJ28_00017823, partial [Nothophytophthora sp. Chile5]